MDFLSATAKMKVKVVMQNISSALQYAMREYLMNSVEEQSHQLTVGCDRMDDPMLVMSTRVCHILLYHRKLESLSTVLFPILFTNWD